MIKISIITTIIISLLAILSMFFSFSFTVYAENIVPNDISIANDTKLGVAGQIDTIKGIITGYSLLYGVDPKLALFVAEFESSYNPKQTGDDFLCTFKYSPNINKPVMARGLWQFTDCYFPEISDEVAFDVASSTKIAMPLLKDKKKCIRTWTVCRNYYDKK